MPAALRTPTQSRNAENRDGQASHVQSRVDMDAAARKRQEIGLSPRRATAQEAILRPPVRTSWAPSRIWLFAGSLALALLLIVTLAIGRGRAVTRAQSPSGAVISLVRGASFLTIQDDFSAAGGPLVRDFQPRRWSMGVVPAEGVYRIRMWPGVIAWSTLGAGNAANFRLSTDVTILPETPWGYGGLMARFSNENNFYLVQVDGAGRFRIQTRADGVWSTLQDWTASGVLLQAGSANHLEIVDDAEGVTVWANGAVIFTAPPSTLPAGDAGVIAGSLDAAVAEANFDAVALSPLP
jgi:hypothetical protein